MDFFCRFCLPCLPFLQPDPSSHLLPPPPTHQKTESSIASNHRISATLNLQNATSLEKTASSSSSYSSLSRSDSLPISVDPTEVEIMMIPSVERSNEAMLRTHELCQRNSFLPLAVSADMMKLSSSAEDLKSIIEHTEHILQSPTYTEFSPTDMTSFTSDATTSSSVYQSFNYEILHSPQFGGSEAEGARHSSSQPIKSHISHSQTVQKNERHSLSDTFDVLSAPSDHGRVKPQNRRRQEVEVCGAHESERSVRRFGDGVRMKERAAEGEAGGRRGSGIWMLQKQIRDQMKRNLKGIKRQMKKKKRKKKP